MINSQRPRLAAGVAVAMLASGTLALVHSSAPAAATACAATQADGASESAGVSADGRSVLFFSESGNLVPGGLSGRHLYLRDLAGCTTRLIDITNGGVLPDGPVTGIAQLTPNGRYVAFSSSAADIAWGVAGGVSQAYVRDLRTQMTELISIQSNGRPGSAWSAVAGVSNDGRYVLLQSDAGLGQGSPRYVRNVWLRDRVLATTFHKSTVPPSSVTPTWTPHLSPDGRFNVEDQVPTRPPGEQRWVTTLSDSLAGSPPYPGVGTPTTGSGYPNDSTFAAGVSAGGQFVLFNSAATDLVAGDTNGVSDAFVRYVGVGWTVRVSVSGSAGNQASLGGAGTSISQDGRYVVFESDSADLVADDTNDHRDVFVRDLAGAFSGYPSPSTTRVSVAGDEGQANGDSGGGQVSADGRFVVFWSDASNLVPDDTNGARDVFLRDLGAGTTVRVSVG